MNEGLYFYDTDGRCLHGVYVKLNATKIYITSYRINNVEYVEGSLTGYRYLKKVTSYPRDSYFYFSELR